MSAYIYPPKPSPGTLASRYSVRNSGDCKRGDRLDDGGGTQENTGQNTIATDSVPQSNWNLRRLSSYLFPWRKKLPNISSEPQRLDRRKSYVQRIDELPPGYPQLAAFMNSDDNFLIARKFGYLRARVLLYRQDELSVLERDLIALDNDDKEKRAIALQSRKYDEATDKDPVYSRKVLIQKIDDKLKEYDELVRRVRTTVSLKAPTGRDFQSLVNWMRAYKPLTVEESRFLQHTADFVTLSNENERGWVNDVTEDTLSRCLPKIFWKKLFGSKQQLITDDEHLRRCSKRRIDGVVSAILVLTTTALLIGPTAILFLIPGHSTLKLCLLVAFTLLFAVALTIFTTAKRHEMLAAAATYAAVLVVFLGSSS